MMWDRKSGSGDKQSKAGSPQSKSDSPHRAVIWVDSRSTRLWKSVKAEGDQMTNPNQQMNQATSQQGPVTPIQGTNPGEADKKPWYKKWWIWAIVVVVFVAIAAAISGENKEQITGDEPEAAVTQSEGGVTVADEEVVEAVIEGKGADVGSLGEAITSGSFSVVVEGISDPVTKIGSDMVGTDEQSEFLLVDVSVTNDSDEAAAVSNSSFKLLSGEIEFEPSTSDALYLEGDALVFDKINPGNTLTGQLVFDVPEGTIIDAIVFQDGRRDEPAIFLVE